VIGQRLTLARVYLCRGSLDFRKGTHSLTVLVERGLGLDPFGGTLVDAAITAAPSSTKDEDRARNRGMHQTRKGTQYAFGAKAHLGADADCGPVPTVTATAANVADISDIAETARPLHRQETEVYPDAGYVGAHKRDERKGCKVQSPEPGEVCPESGQTAEIPAGHHGAGRSAPWRGMRESAPSPAAVSPAPGRRQSQDCQPRS
jgi:hypothetical protein